MLKKNNKRNTYIMLPIVLAIWGVIFFKVFLGNRGGEIDTNQLPASFQHDLKDTLVTNSYELDLSYDDPFLGITSTPKVTKNSSPESSGNTLEETLILPNIIYSGYVKNEESVSAYLNIDGEIIIAEENKEYADVKVLKILPDSVLVYFKNKQEWIKI
ncbi:MAG: hypothetical protein JXR69_03050 [Candidatus Delongbacteria bacterium]|nr:hypothetical protein [Candidatus Delongbacteria bacterium]